MGYRLLTCTYSSGGAHSSVAWCNVAHHGASKRSPTLACAERYLSQPKTQDLELTCPTFSLCLC